MNIRQISDDFFTIGDIAILQKMIGNAGYDFPFRTQFECRSVVSEMDRPILLRIGAVDDYHAVETYFREAGMQLLMTETDHLRCSEIENWYPLLAEHTPYTKVYDQLPAVDQLMKDFSFPVFIKGTRQTDKHKRANCIIQNAEDYEQLRLGWKQSRILSWQQAAVREYVPLLTIDDTSFPEMIPISYEFRSFYYQGRCTGCGPYWTLGRRYALADEDRQEVMDLSQWAADRLNVAFLTVDVAKTADGRWIIVEANDGQESGFVGLNPISLWKKTIEAAQG